MTLHGKLECLKKLDFIKDNTDINVCLNRGKSIKTNDRVFEVELPVKQADEFFGHFEVTLNQVRNTDSGIPRFWFLLAYEEN